jgi:site-specific recombinase XerD
LNKSDAAERLPEFLTELKYAEKAANTLKKYQTNIEAFIGYLQPDKEIIKDDTLAFKQFLINLKFQTSTINSYIVSVNKYLKWLDHKELIVKQLKQQRKGSLEEVINLSDYKRMLRFAKTCGRMDIYYIMKILVMTGIRISELKYFTVENLKTNYILAINKGKERNIILRQDLVRELRKYCRENNIKTGYIFPGQARDRMINESTVWRNMQRIAGNAKIKKSKIHAHSFRHLFAKLYLDEFPNNITELADILGHNSLETTRIYTRSTDAEKREKIERIRY